MTGADLHMHSTASDGTDEPLQLPDRMRQAGIEIFALTDHDTVRGAQQLKQNPPEDLTFIPGIEFSCIVPDLGTGKKGKCHILGYCCDTENGAFREVLEEGAGLRLQKLNVRLDFLAERGMPLPPEDAEQLRRMVREGCSAGKPHLGNLMVKYGYAETRDAAIRDVLNLCPTENSRVDGEKAVRAIRASGGVPVWAHPLGGVGEKPMDRETFEALMERLCGAGLAGLECWYSLYPEERCLALEGEAERRGLLVSGGSDYHGTNKKTPAGMLNAEGRPVPESRLTVIPELLSRCS